MRAQDQKSESTEVTSAVEEAKKSPAWGRRIAQITERPEKTKEVEEAKKKGK